MTQRLNIKILMNFKQVDNMIICDFILISLHKKEQVIFDKEALRTAIK